MYAGQQWTRGQKQSVWCLGKKAYRQFLAQVSPASGVISGVAREVHQSRTKRETSPSQGNGTTLLFLQGCVHSLIFVFCNANCIGSFKKEGGIDQLPSLNILVKKVCSKFCPDGFFSLLPLFIIRFSVQQNRISRRGFILFSCLCFLKFSIVDIHYLGYKHTHIFKGASQASLSLSMALSYFRICCSNTLQQLLQKLNWVFQILLRMWGR